MILLFGGSGLLGRHLKADVAPSHKECDISDLSAVRKTIEQANPDIIINSVALLDNEKIEQNPNPAILTNIIGAANVALCSEGRRYVFISTDYVYPGTVGEYSEGSNLNPVNLYAWTKLGGECSARAVKDHLIIRTSFGNNFKHAQAYTNHFTSKDHIEVIAPMILKAALSKVTGIINIGTNRKSIYEYASLFGNPSAVKSTFLDTSLNTKKYEMSRM